MKTAFGILKITAIIIIVLIVSLFTVSVFMQDKVAGIILKSVNREISTKFTIGSTHLSFLKKFPNASLDLKNVVVFSSPGFDKSLFSNQNTDTLLTAKTVRAEFSITDIINGIYNIDRISVLEGHLNLLTDTAGKVNYEITSGTVKSNDIFTINLSKISLSGISATYNNLATKLLIKGRVHDGQLKTRISGDYIDFNARAGIQVSWFSLFNFRIARSVMTQIDLNLHKSDKGFLFEKSSLEIDNYDFEIAGKISDQNVMDLSLIGKNINIGDLKKYIPDRYLQKISAYNPSGLVSFDSKIRGIVSRRINPGIDIGFILSDGSIAYANSSMMLTDLSLHGSFTNGNKRNPETSSLSIDEFRGMLGSAMFSGTLRLDDFNSLKGNLTMTGRIIAPEFREFFNLKKISSAEGSIDFSLKMKGNIPKKPGYVISDIFALRPQASLKFSSFGIGLMNDSVKVENIEGDVDFDGLIRTENLAFIYRDHKIEFKGLIRNLPDWIEGKPVLLSITGDLALNQLLPEKLLEKSASSDSASAVKAVKFRDDIILDLKYRIGHFEYKSFSASDIEGILSYKPKLLNLKTLSLKSLEGSATGNGFLAQNKDKSVIGRGSFDLDKVNINGAFVAFRNFGQDFIKAENLAGNISGSFSVLIPMDSLMHPRMKSVTAEGKYILENGNLINFGPVKELSSFIELSELENIKFEKLENDFFIRDNTLYIPQMDVRSSAADLSVNGKHSFENNYEYHVKILLSEMLSRKIRKPKPNTTEFGAVKDEGLGRTSVLLKIVNKGSDVKVSYDAKAAGNIIRNDIKKEKQTLKTILNQEYGWFKNDTAATAKPAAREPRFRITWEETDTVRQVSDTPPAKNGDPVKNLFRKKRLN